MMSEYIAPSFNSKGFNCPHCNAFAEQNWMDVQYQPDTVGRSARNDYRTATCFKCKDISFWHDNKMIYPIISTAPKPHADMPDEIKTDYEEARSIVNFSPRSACVLLRLCIEKLCNKLVSGSGDLNEKIGKLVEKGLDPDIQRALDAIRVIGGQAIHPLQMDLKDDPKTATALFVIANHIVSYTISKSKQIKEIYDILPDDKKKAIQSRDSKNSN